MYLSVSVTVYNVNWLVDFNVSPVTLREPKAHIQIQHLSVEVEPVCHFILGSPGKEAHSQTLSRICMYRLPTSATEQVDSVCPVDNMIATVDSNGYIGYPSACTDASFWGSRALQCDILS